MAEENNVLEVIGGNARGRLISFVERLERLAEEKAELSEDIKEVFGEAKGEGFDVKILRKVLRARSQDAAKRQEEEAMFDLYWAAIKDGAA